MNKSLSIVVPCYNEKDNIPLILERFDQVIGNRNIEVVLVDNGSTDGSAELMDALLPRYTFARKVTVEVNQGYGFGIVSGLKTCQSDYIGFTHADMQTDPNDVSIAYDRIDQTPKYIKGNRKGRPFLDVFFTIGMSLFETVYFKKRLWDINAQPNVFPKTFFEDLTEIPQDFSLDLYLYVMAKTKQLPILRFDVRFTERIHGFSKWNDATFKSKWKFIKRTTAFSKELKRSIIRKER